MACRSLSRNSGLMSASKPIVGESAVPISILPSVTPRSLRRAPPPWRDGGSGAGQPWAVRLQAHGVMT
jgi:hypothetical protein